MADRYADTTADMIQAAATRRVITKIELATYEAKVRDEMATVGVIETYHLILTYRNGLP